MFGGLRCELFLCALRLIRSEATPILKIFKVKNDERFHMHRAVCDLDSVRDQADGEPQRVAGAARGAGGDFVFQVVLQRRVRAVHRVGVGESVAGGFREAARMA